MSYLDSGYNSSFQRILVPESQDEDINSFDFDSKFESVPGEKIVGGIIRSQDGRMGIDLDKGLITVNDGVVDRISMGRFESGEYGLIITDQSGNEVFNITGSNNILRSNDGQMEIDLTENQIRFFEGAILRILMGRQQGGF